MIARIIVAANTHIRKQHLPNAAFLTTRPGKSRKTGLKISIGIRFIIYVSSEYLPKNVETGLTVRIFIVNTIMNIVKKITCGSCVT